MDFVKYHGTGNDFIIIDNRDNNYLKNLNNKQKKIRELCLRRTGIGADGLIEVEASTNSDFKMFYYNSDGREGPLCGNGGRCIAAFAWQNNIADKNMQFEASDGIHDARIIESKNNTVLVDLKISDIFDIFIHNDYMVINTGAPHYVSFIDNLNDVNMYEEGKKIRHHENFFPEGVNVNFVEPFKDHLFVRTFERGVENETLSCGTGVTAAAIAAHLKGIEYKANNYPILTKGGKLNISFKPDKKNKKFKEVWLKGNAVKVFEGNLVNT